MRSFLTAPDLHLNIEKNLPISTPYRRPHDTYASLSPADRVVNCKKINNIFGNNFNVMQIKIISLLEMNYY